MNDIGFGKSKPALAVAAPGAAPGTSEEQPLVAQYLNIARRWKWLILACVGIAMVIGVLVTLLATREYTATTRLEISREASQIVNVRDLEPETSAIDMEFYQTQYSLLESRSLAQRVVRELRLVENEAFFTMFGHDEMLGSGGPSGEQVVSREERERLAIKTLLDNLEVSPIRLSRLVDVSFTSPDPSFSAQVANTWANEFIASNLERRFEATSYARRFLEDRLAQLRGKLEESERELVGYASNQAIINLPAGEDVNGRTQERSLTADSLEALNEALAQATADRIAAESRLGRASSTSSRESLANPAISSLRQSRAQAAAEYSRLMTQFEPEYPPARALAAEIEQLDRSIAREEARVGGSLRDAYRDAAQREQSLQARVNALKEGFLDQRRRSIQYNIFQRDVDTNRELYDGLLQRYKEIGVAGGVGANNVSIVDRAPVPEEPSSPNPLLNMALSLLAGLIAGIVLALIREQMDETIRDPAEVERRLYAPLLGVIPNAQGDDPYDEVNDVKSGLAEAYLSVQSSLTFATDHGIPRTLTVTSTRAAEGKSTTAYAIAYGIARDGLRTVLVDADMRSPSVHSNLGLRNERGLSNYLSGTDDLVGLLQEIPAGPMTILTAGPQPPNAAELLRSSRFEGLLAELLQHFDQVVIDSPPVLGLADAPSIASRTEGAIYVVESGSVKERLARRALDRLRQARANILGIVLTRFDPRRAHLGYEYDYGYGYGYGTSYGNSETKPTSA